MRNLFYLVVLVCTSSANAGTSDDFFRAVRLDDARTVTQLLERGFDPNAVDEKGVPALALALRESSPKVAAALLAAPQIKVDATTPADETPVMMAALRGQPQWTQRLLDRGAQVNRPGWTPLHYAACGPEPEVVALLLARGAAVEALSPNRTTPLMMASRYGPEKAVDMLLARGASLKARNDAGLNAADFARLAGRESLAQRLDLAGR